MTPYERKQTREALNWKPKPSRPKGRSVYRPGTAKERGCGLEEAQYEREMLAAAYAEAAARRKEREQA